MRFCLTCQKIVDLPSDHLKSGHTIDWENKFPVDEDKILKKI